MTVPGSDDWHIVWLVYLRARPGMRSRYHFECAELGVRPMDAPRLPPEGRRRRWTKRPRR